MISDSPIVTAAIARFKKDMAGVTPTPLAIFLHIYTKASHECYINHMEGTKALAAYLAPIDIKEPNTIIPDILNSYELYEIAKILIPHTLIPLDIYQIENSIYEYFTQSR